LPGRIVGETVDVDGNRAFVLTLQAREQHIRREKASSNICSNQALCAMTAAVYMAAMGPGGLRQVATQCFSKAHYAASKISEIPGFGLCYQGEFFHEFLTGCPVDVTVVMGVLEKEGILGGYPTNDIFRTLDCFVPTASRNDRYSSKQEVNLCQLKMRNWKRLLRNSRNQAGIYLKAHQRNGLPDIKIMWN